MRNADVPRAGTAAPPGDARWTRIEDAHAHSAASVCEALDVSATAGLPSDEILVRRREFGPNKIPSTPPRTWLQILKAQLASFMTLLLVLAAGVSLATQEPLDASAIMALLGLNVTLGFTQEYRAERAIAGLQRMSPPQARVRRGGQDLLVAAQELVPGDVLLLEAGVLVPADARLVSAFAFRAQEAPLTGESVAVEKDAQAVVPASTLLGDRTNMVFQGTLVVAGRSEAVVVATGSRTELGRIANLVRRGTLQPTPMQKRLERFARILAIVSLGVVGVVFLLGLWRGEELRIVFLTAVSLAVAAVPEGLPAVVTIALALGARRMVRRQALVRRLSAVETLGSVDVICADKTGTLTQNKMTVERTLPSTTDDAGRVALLLAAVLCNDATLGAAPDTTRQGDPTELALLAAARDIRLEKDRLESSLPRLHEIPFSPQRKMMSTVHVVRYVGSEIAAGLSAFGVTAGDRVLVSKGAAEAILPLCRLDAAKREANLGESVALARAGFRVLAAAVRPLRGDEPPSEEGLRFLGLLALVDPPRPEAAAAVATCKEAGIRPIMITGDHPETAAHIARRLGILDGERLLVGTDVAGKSVAALAASMQDVAVFARVAPEHKLAIVEALQAQGHIVAMTGDGVNDAPALRQADIGVAMGQGGTDVAREASDLVLLDDNFATIVAAVEQGRMVYDNIRKFLRYLLTTNSAEIGLMLIAPIAGMPLPLLPLQILWVNLVTDGLPALALGLEPLEKDAMRRPPAGRAGALLGEGLGRHVIWVGALMGLLAFGIGFAEWRVGNPHWQAVTFTAIVFLQLAHVLVIRTGRWSIVSRHAGRNPWLWTAVAATALAQVVLLSTPSMQAVFNVSPLSAQEYLLIAVACGLLIVAVEAERFLTKRHDGRGS